MPKPKKLPMRMCIGCQEMKVKKELIRIVRTPEGTVEIDRTGKRNGRGAYICPHKECLEKAIKAKRLGKALKHNINQEVYTMLRQEIENVE